MTRSAHVAPCDSADAFAAKTVPIVPATSAIAATAAVIRRRALRRRTAGRDGTGICERRSWNSTSRSRLNGSFMSSLQSLTQFSRCLVCDRAHGSGDDSENLADLPLRQPQRVARNEDGALPLRESRELREQVDLIIPALAKRVPANHVQGSENSGAPAGALPTPQRDDEEPPFGRGDRLANRERSLERILDCVCCILGRCAHCDETPVDLWISRLARAKPRRIRQVGVINEECAHHAEESWTTRFM